MVFCYFKWDQEQRWACLECQTKSNLRIIQQKIIVIKTTELKLFSGPTHAFNNIYSVSFWLKHFLMKNSLESLTQTDILWVDAEASFSDDFGVTGSWRKTSKVGELMNTDKTLWHVIWCTFVRYSENWKTLVLLFWWDQEKQMCSDIKAAENNGTWRVTKKRPKGKF